MSKANWLVFKILITQVGLIRACRLTFLKAFARILSPGVSLHYSQTGEDIVLRFLVDKHIKKAAFTFVEVGCNDPRRISSTYLHYLRGASGLAIDMMETYSAAFGRERPNDIFVCAAVSDVPGEAYLHEFSAPEVNTISVEQALVWADHWKPQGQRLVETHRLIDLVRSHLGDRDIDVLLLDVEGHELPVLRGANLNQLKPTIIVCEVHDLEIMHSSSNPVVAFLKKNGYQIVAFATMNAYFLRNPSNAGNCPTSM